MKHTQIGPRRSSRRLDGTRIGSAEPERFEEVDDPQGLTEQQANARPSRPGKKGQAKILEPKEVDAAIEWLAKHERVPEAAVLKFQLAFRAGLRACEISRLRMRHVTDANGQIANTIEVPASVAKNGRGRSVPMHAAIRAALEAYRRRFPGIDHLAACKANGKHQKENTCAVWFHNVFRRMGLKGCSSHSGRRTFITHLARNVETLGMTLRDVQVLAGHARLDTTQGYIQPSRDLHRLVDSLPGAPMDAPRQVPPAWQQPTPWASSTAGERR